MNMYCGNVRQNITAACTYNVHVNKSCDFEREPEYYNYRSIDPETTVTIKASSLAPLPYSEDSVHSTVVNPPRARPGQYQQIPLVVGLSSHLM